MYKFYFNSLPRFIVFPSTALPNLSLTLMFMNWHLRMALHVTHQPLFQMFFWGETCKKAGPSPQAFRVRCTQSTGTTELAYSVSWTEREEMENQRKHC